MLNLIKVVSVENTLSNLEIRDTKVMDTTLRGGVNIIKTFTVGKLTVDNVVAERVKYVDD